MQGEGTKCDEYGIHTKLISKHGGACPLCVRWQGRVVIDDVYSSGTAEESKKTGFPLLSQAIADGMFHPNCKNGLSLFIPGINAVPEQPTAEEIKSQTEQYDLEQKQRYNERQIRKYKRLADGSLDPENQKKYTEKLREWQKRQRDLIGQHPDKLRRQYDREQTAGIPAELEVPVSDVTKPSQSINLRNILINEPESAIIKPGIEPDDVVISDKVLSHSDIGEFTGYSNPKKPEKGGGKFLNGGHSQANIEELKRRKIEYNIVKVYENGVRAGHVPEHKNDFKRTGIGQAWFPEDWTVEDIRKAGQYVFSHRDVVIENRSKDNKVTSYTFFSEYRGITIGVTTDIDGNISNKNGTIFPDNRQRRIEGGALV